MNLECEKKEKEKKMHAKKYIRQQKKVYSSVIQQKKLKSFSFELKKSFKTSRVGSTHLQGLHQRSVCSRPHRARHFFNGFPAKFAKT